MIDPEMVRQLKAVRDGEITDAPLVRPILCDATRALDRLLDEVLEANAMLSDAKKNFAMGWEPEFLESDDD
jgi:hypothetical protein